MTRFALTYEIAHAIATDDANRHMRQHGRRHWAASDLRIAINRQEQLLATTEVQR